MTMLYMSEYYMYTYIHIYIFVVYSVTILLVITILRGYFISCTVLIVCFYIVATNLRQFAHMYLDMYTQLGEQPLPPHLCSRGMWAISNTP